MELSEIIASISTFFALLALYFTFTQGRRQTLSDKTLTTHTEILNDPNLKVRWDRGFEDKGVAWLAVSVCNEGLGAAKIVSFTSKWKEKEIGMRDLIHNPIEAMHVQKTQFSNLAIGSTVRSAETKQLAKLKFLGSTDDDIDNFQSHYEDARIHIAYQSFFNDEIKTIVVGEG